ncbi:50S ribosomal protein L24 [Didymella exigua CBS 183.55]|uniref:Large ribosomal subunit protein bL28m n=1 Tax=Didymella exigua CBS 183.55 TaxID=1150837 RepID=A0A6A5RBI3_9PLEO|nr:50S ribosomal protein L24 [Didymella exigua CBS 183.55]KAF1924709.1 50S ribosomal protein L24 [Didymella exigua CBS 183.55]
MHPRCQLLSGHLVTVTRAPQPAQRTLTTSATLYNKNPLQRRKGGDLGSHLPKHVISKDPHIPDYPYGDFSLFKQANKGLYGEQMIQFGNNVSHKTETKTRRKWTPNVLSKSLYSVALKKRIKLKVTSNVVKIIDREGGLDEYLLKDSIHRIKELGPTGWALRWTLMQKPEVIERLRAEAAALGIDQATIDKQWPTPAMQKQQSYADRVLAREAVLAQAGEVEDVDQGMWAEEEGAEDEVEGTESTIGDVLNEQEIRARKRAHGEYMSAQKAARRYLSRGYVDSEEEGLKIAFVQQKKRTDTFFKHQARFTEKAKELFTREDLKALKKRLKNPPKHITALRKLAFKEREKAQAEAAGGWEPYNEVKKASNAEKLAALKARVEECGGAEAVKASRKAELAKALAEAETASTNQSLDEKTRQYYESAINKADMAIKAKQAGGVQGYVEMALEELKKASSPGLSELFKGSRKEKNPGGDAWAALVNSSNTPAESRPHA